MRLPIVRGVLLTPRPNPVVAPPASWLAIFERQLVPMNFGAGWRQPPLVLGRQPVRHLNEEPGAYAQWH